jgi:hypothetical protein
MEYWDDTDEFLEWKHDIEDTTKLIDGWWFGGMFKNSVRRRITISCLDDLKKKGLDKLCSQEVRPTNIKFVTGLVHTADKTLKKVKKYG